MKNIQKLLVSGIQNHKLAKNTLRSYILYLAPYNLSGFNVCPSASPGCANSCLFSAGRGGMHVVQEARMRKTKLFFNDMRKFYSILHDELTAVNKIGAAVRLNGTSDIDHAANYRKYSKVSLFDAFPDVIFYDYTKRIDMCRKYVVSPYALTFSRSENNENRCLEALSLNFNVAAVFAPKLPEFYLGRPVISGDENDDRHLDPKGVIIGLTAKGKAKKDSSGFVVNIN